MARKESILIDMTIPLKTIESEIDRLRTTGSRSDAAMARRLELIRYRYKGLSVVQSADLLRVNIQSGYNWQAAWNRGGIEALRSGTSTGRPPLVTPQQLEFVAKRAHFEKWNTRQVRQDIKLQFGVDYTPAQIRDKLTDIGMRFVQNDGSDKSDDGFWTF